MELKYKFLGYDEGNQTLGTYDTTDTNWGWSFSLKDLPMGRDLQLVESNIVLVGFDRGYFEIDINSGKPTKIVDRWSNVTSARRLKNGNTLITGQDLIKKGINVITLDPNDEIINTVYRTGDYVRMMRPTDTGTYLLGSDDHFLEVDKDLKYNRTLQAPGFEHAWLAHRYSDGTTLLSAGYGAFMANFDYQGNLENTFGSKKDVPEIVSPFFYAAFEILPNGGVLVANWQGHGKDNGNKGRQLVEFDTNGKYVGSWSNSSRISSLQGILLLK
ncbi:MAG: hypothetical protein OCD02_00440 [Spirochaetaceae bacterium]